MPEITFETLMETNTSNMERVAQADMISIHRVDVEGMKFVPVTYYVLDLITCEIYGTATSLNGAFEVAVIKVKERMHQREVGSKERVPCDKCSTRLTADRMVMSENGNICLSCHNFKHELMGDPKLEKTCGFCKKDEEA